MATTAEADLCNLALARIGQLRPITDLDPTVDTSAAAARCALLYPKARDRLLARTRWRWATRLAILAPDAAITAGSAKALPGYDHAYSDPADLVYPQYIFDGVRPSAAAVPLTSQLVAGVTAVSMLPAIAGVVPQVPFEHVAGHIFTDWSDDAPAWDATVTYGLNAVVSYLGLYYRSAQAGNVGNVPTTPIPPLWVATTDPSMAQLVYTAKVTDVTLFPPTFVDALAVELAADLALGLAGEPQLSRALKEEARLTLNIALAAEGNGRQPDVRPDSSFISGRG